MTAGIGSARTTVAPSNTTPPAVTGTAHTDQLLTTDDGKWAGTTPLSYAYQWRTCNGTGGSCQDISGATGNEYTVRAADAGNTIRSQVTAKNSDGSDTATSVPTAAIVVAAASSGTGCPALSRRRRPRPDADGGSPRQRPAGGHLDR